MKRGFAFFLLIVIVATGCRKNKVGSFVSPVIDPSFTYDNRSVGASAKDILGRGMYNSITLEIQYAPQQRPSDTVVKDVLAFLEKYCNKTENVQSVITEIPVQGGALTINNLTTIEARLRESYTSYDTSNNKDDLSIYVMITESTYQNPNILGIAYRNTSIGLFGGAIEANSGAADQPSKNKLTATVLKHELGHLMGLVNTGTPMQTNHQDNAHGKHCDNPDCLMYHTMQTTEGISKLASGFVPTLDENCMNDLRANGGK